MVQLFSPLKLRDMTFKNRIVVSPMCQYSAVDGLAQDWHLVHYGALARGGSAAVILEATAVSPEGRISPQDLGLWSSEHQKALAPLVRQIHSHKCLAGVQLAHAGRKASCQAPWFGGGILNPSEGGWPVLGPSALSYSARYPVPQALTESQMQMIQQKFVQSALWADGVGFDFVEIHMAHGYLLHNFLSPLSNQRNDSYGGSLENRMRFPLAVAESVRAQFPANKPVLVRISASDWVPGGWDLEQSLVFTNKLKALGIDLIDTSSGGNSPEQKIEIKPGYQVAFSEAIRRQTQIPTGAVGLITTSAQAEGILKENKADLIIMGRELLRDPHWPLRAAHELHAQIEWPQQYQRALWS